MSANDRVRILTCVLSVSGVVCLNLAAGRRPVTMIIIVVRHCKEGGGPGGQAFEDEVVVGSPSGMLPKYAPRPNVNIAFPAVSRIWRMPISVVT